jgi:hypothetical protein
MDKCPLGIPTLQGKLKIGEEEQKKKPYFLSFLSKMNITILILK